MAFCQCPWFHLGSKALRASQPITRLLLTGSCLHHSWVFSLNSCVQHEANISKPISTYFNLMSLAKLLEFRGGTGPLASRSLRPWNSRGIASPWVSFVSTRRRCLQISSDWVLAQMCSMKVVVDTHTEIIRYIYIYLIIEKIREYERCFPWFCCNWWYYAMQCFQAMPFGRWLARFCTSKEHQKAFWRDAAVPRHYFNDIICLKHTVILLLKTQSDSVEGCWMVRRVALSFLWFLCNISRFCSLLGILLPSGVEFLTEAGRQAAIHCCGGA